MKLVVFSNKAISHFNELSIYILFLKEDCNWINIENWINQLQIYKR
jgi:hypothetical protein